MEASETRIVPTDSREKKTWDESTQIMGQIAQRAFELTENPQTDIEPTDLLPGDYTEAQYFRQLQNPKLPSGKEINRAVRLLRNDLGQTNFIIIKDDEGNLASIRMNKGRTDTAYSIEDEINVGSDHQEIVVNVVRRKVLSPGKLGIGRKEEYFNEQILIGGVPGQGVDPRVTRMVQVKDTDRKSFKWTQENFAANQSLSDLPPLALQPSQKNGTPDDESLRAIQRILEDGKIDNTEMMRAMVKKTNMLLTTKEYEDKVSVQPNKPQLT